MPDLTTGAPFSINPVDDVLQLFQFEFMRNALMAGTCAALAAGVIGYFVVLRRLSFAAHTISNLGFAGATGGLALGIPPIYGLLVINTMAAAVIGWLGKREHGRDVIVGIVMTAGLGLGVLFLRLYSAQATVTVLAGDVLGISAQEVRISLVACVVMIAIVATMYRPLLFWSLDEEVAEARGVRPAAMSLLMLMLIAVLASITTPVIGVLLTFAILVGPAATAILITPRPARAVGIAVALSVGYMWIGLALSYWIDVPPSVFITSLAFAGYLLVRWRSPAGTAA